MRARIVERDIQLLLSKMMRFTYRLIFLSTGQPPVPFFLSQIFGISMKWFDTRYPESPRTRSPGGSFALGECSFCVGVGCSEGGFLTIKAFFGLSGSWNLRSANLGWVSGGYLGAEGALGVGDCEEAVVGAELFDVFVFKGVDSAVWVRGAYRGKTGSR